MECREDYGKDCGVVRLLFEAWGYCGMYGKAD